MTQVVLKYDHQQQNDIEAGKVKRIPGLDLNCEKSGEQGKRGISYMTQAEQSIQKPFFLAGPESHIQ